MCSVNKENKANTFIEDVYNSSTYKRLVDQWSCEEENKKDLLRLTITLGTNGATAFKSSNKTIWPLFFFINELPKEYRFSFNFTSLIGYCENKVDMNLFLSYMVIELLELNKGSWITTKESKVFLQVRLFGIMCDLVATNDIIYLKQSNGYFGCRGCQKKGERYNGRNVYSFQGSSSGKFTARSWSVIQEYYKKNSFTDRNEEDIEIDNSTSGIIDKTVLVLLPYFRWIQQFSSNILHNMAEGLCKKLLKCIVKKYKNNLNVVNDKLRKVKTPSFYHRKVRDLNNLAFYKASEYYMIFTYCWSCFEGTLSLQEYNCLKELSSLMNVFMNKIERTYDNLNNLKIRLNNLLINIEVVYGKEILTIASHSVMHFIDNLIYLGPLWFSTFIVEDFVGRLSRFIKGKGTNRLDCKALEMYYILHLSSTLRINSGTFIYIKGDFLHLNNNNYKVIKVKNNLFSLLNLNSNDINLFNLNDLIGSIPLFNINNNFIKINLNDKYLF